LKVLSAELSRDPDFRARFVREADVAAALDHPQIVPVYSRGETGDGQLWIAMHFVDGTDADDALRAGTMTAPRAVHIICEVAKAPAGWYRTSGVSRPPTGMRSKPLRGSWATLSSSWPRSTASSPARCDRGRWRCVRRTCAGPG
jgi:serine/threonine protein kinase